MNTSESQTKTTQILLAGGPFVQYDFLHMHACMHEYGNSKIWASNPATVGVVRWPSAGDTAGYIGYAGLS